MQPQPLGTPALGSRCHVLRVPKQKGLAVRHKPPRGGLSGRPRLASLGTILQGAGGAGMARCRPSPSASGLLEKRPSGRGCCSGASKSSCPCCLHLARTVNKDLFPRGAPAASSASLAVPGQAPRLLWAGAPFRRCRPAQPRRGK